MSTNLAPTDRPLDKSSFIIRIVLPVVLTDGAAPLFHTVVSLPVLRM